MMRQTPVKSNFYAINLFIVVSIAALWSVNTLLELFGHSPVQYKHILALFIAVFILKWSFTRKYRHFFLFKGANNDCSHH